MCGIAFVIEGVRIQCSSCSEGLTSYQQDCGSCGLGDQRSGAGLYTEVSEETGPAVEDLVQELQRRGPDGVHIRGMPLSFPSPTGSMLHMVGAELQLRGSGEVQQPLEDSSRNVLVFNGEVFGGLSVDSSENDGQKLLEALVSACACSQSSSSEDSQEEHCHRCHCETVVQILSTLRGPWALAYFQRASQTLWYGRDFVGRRSLVAHLPDRQDGRFIVSSVAVSKCILEADSQNGSVGPGSSLSACPIQNLEVDEANGTEETESSRALNLEARGVLLSDSAGSELPSIDTAKEEGALFDFWVDVPSGVYSIDLQNGAHRKHAWTDPLVKRLCRWERQLVHPPSDSEVLESVREVAFQDAAGAKNGVSNGSHEKPEGEKILNRNENLKVENKDNRKLDSALQDFQKAADLLLEALSKSVAKRVTGIRKRPFNDVCANQSRSKASNGIGGRILTDENDVGSTESKEEGAEKPNIGVGRDGPSVEHRDEAELERNRADVAILFSGGLDSMVLAALADRHVTEGGLIDLINVCFDDGKSPDRLSALAGLKELERMSPTRRWQLIEVDSSLEEVDQHKKRLLSLICPSQTYMDLNIGAALWLAARAQGFVSEEASIDGSDVTLNNGSASTSLDGTEEPPINGPGHYEASRTIDRGQSSSTVELSMTAEPLDPQQIEGSSISKGNGDEFSRRKKTDSNSADYSIEKLSVSRQKATENNVNGQPSYVQTHREKCASSARVLLVGSGADEQCAGYGRHRTKFRSGGWQLLDAEMRLDVLRLWQRNLGRDDRCIADHGKEARFPFLDEDVMDLLLSVPLWIVADLRKPLGVGDKALLREVARKLGIQGAASLPKRAIQFGSRIARASNRRDFGSNRAANLSSAGAVSFRTARPVA